jgi:hypothetical protein
MFDRYAASLLAIHRCGRFKCGKRVKNSHYKASNEVLAPKLDIRGLRAVVESHHDGSSRCPMIGYLDQTPHYRMTQYHGHDKQICNDSSVTPLLARVILSLVYASNSWLSASHVQCICHATTVIILHFPPNIACRKLEIKKKHLVAGRKLVPNWSACVFAQ